MNENTSIQEYCIDNLKSLCESQKLNLSLLNAKINVLKSLLHHLQIDIESAENFMEHSLKTHNRIDNLMKSLSCEAGNE